MKTALKNFKIIHLRCRTSVKALVCHLLDFKLTHRFQPFINCNLLWWLHMKRTSHIESISCLAPKRTKLNLAYSDSSLTINSFFSISICTINTSFSSRQLHLGQFTNLNSSSSFMVHFSPNDKFTDGRCHVTKRIPQAEHSTSISSGGVVIANPF